MRNGSESMEQHGSELNDQNQGEEEHKHQTDWLELEIFLCDVNLNRCGKIILENLLGDFLSHLKQVNEITQQPH